MEESLRGLPAETLKRYMDDLIAGASDFELFRKLAKTFEALRKAQLTLKLAKCKFAWTEVTFLGFRLSQNGLQPGREKLRAITDLPRPKTAREVRGFLGLCGYFRRFIAGFARISAPLTALTKKDTVFSWTPACENAFEELKSRLTSAPVLATFDAARETERNEQTECWHPVTYISRRTTAAEANYHATELELLAAVWAISRLRIYLYGKALTLITDCDAVRQGLKKRQLVPRIARWVLKLMDFNFDVKHRPGSQMSHMDALSRQTILDDETGDDFTARFEVWSLAASEDWIQAAQLKDEDCRRICQDVNNGHGVTDSGRYQEVEGRLYFKPKGGECRLLVLPYRLRRDVTRQLHESHGHVGLDGTVAALRHRFWFPRMRRTVRSVIGACISCLVLKEPGGRRPGFLNVIERKKKLLHTVHLDHIGPFPRSRTGHRFLLVAVCNFTKLVMLRAVTSTSAHHTIKAVRSIVESLWIPDRIVADRGRAFKNRLLEQFCHDLQIQLRCMAFDLAVIDSALARTVDDAHEAGAPDSDEAGNLDYSEQREAARERAHKMITQSQARYKAQFDKHRCAARPFKIGDIVVVRRAPLAADGQPRKLAHLYRGPYEITRCLRNDLYEIAGLDGTRRYKTTAPADQLKRWDLEDDAEATDSEEDGSESPEHVGWPNEDRGRAAAKQQA
ncbi:Transposon Ty3-G Gag-Pol polyprotein-like protein [Dinothrombium tinctorium]|uniref:RNA-directed DNA polymerase n=1 Tax=Dinothrombium tinctorium TaxID=1965070 RepID=A0A3S3NHQ0_9ACAR|nr:Transposon Ty3-G Gag-Pol polyprotein-like protein [Dinothrombium tinctorium]